MEKQLYISEPQHVDVKRAKGLLSAEGWAVTEGTVNFAEGDQENYSALMIRSETCVDQSILTHFPHLKSIIRIGTGLDNVDLEFCKKNDIAVYNAAGANADAVAEYVITMALYVLRKINTLTTEDVMAWDRFKFRGASLHEQKVGLIGFGHIGWSLYRHLEAAGCKSIYVYDPYVSPSTLPEKVTQVASIDEIFSRSSLISVQTPLTKTTKNLVSMKEISLLPEEAVLINVSHGGVVDESAVVKALGDRRRFTYISDTVSDEPHPNTALLNHPNIILTPHVASLTGAAEAAMLEQAIANFLSQTTTI